MENGLVVLRPEKGKTHPEYTIYEVCLYAENTIIYAYVAEKEMTLNSTLSSLKICQKGHRSPV